MNARLSYRQDAVRGASAIGLVVLLYEQAIEDLRAALAALKTGLVEERTRAINHALLVMAQLQASLDFQRGGRTANTLAQFYKVMRSRLSLAQAEQSAQIVREVMEHLMAVRTAWIEAENRVRVSEEKHAQTPSSGREWSA